MESKRRFLSAVITVLASLVLTVTSASSQTSNKVIEWSKSPLGRSEDGVKGNTRSFRQIEGVEIEDITVNGKTITVREPFTASDDWLRKITFRVRNISGQRFDSIQITVVLPEMGNASPDVPFCYGCDAIERSNGIQAGEVVELKMLGGEFNDWLRTKIAESGISRIDNVEIHHMYVNVTGGPMWFSSCVKTANPKNACPRHTP
ncbi:MAG TPA: hypothetical protein VJU84_01680 [Pyrinomonadaceae bacterium]|nr:hypothetical protein [Pyrinomonadaceae bacterium]